MKEIQVRSIRSAAEKQPVKEFKIRRIEDIVGGQDMSQPLHRHDFYFILAVEKGSGVHEIDFTAYSVCGHSIFFLRPGQVHQLRLQAETTGFLMEFSRNFCHRQQDPTQQRLKNAASKNYCHNGSGGFQRLFGILNAIFNEFANRQEDYIEAIRAHLDLFFIEYIRQSHNPAGISTTAGGYQQQRFEELMELIGAKITEFKNVTDYAALMNLSAYQLNAITKTSVGKTVSDLISEQIILEAKRYLLATTEQVTDIADHLGYEDVSYFIRVFKKHTGYSPDIFRKNFK